MPSNVQALAPTPNHAATQITASHESWTDFLKTVARLYQHPYHEQLMINAQRPDATACADYEIWNGKMRRYVRHGSKGIALIDASGDRPSIRYVFDVSDTGSRDDSRRPLLWQYHPEHEDSVTAALEQKSMPWRTSFTAGTPDGECSMLSACLWRCFFPHGAQVKECVPNSVEIESDSSDIVW